MLTSVTYFLEEPAPPDKNLLYICEDIAKKITSVVTFVMVKYFLLLLLVFLTLTFSQKFAFYPTMSNSGEVDTHISKF